MHHRTRMGNCLNTIQPEIDKSGEKESYIYRHPSDCAMMIKVGEPNSPAPIDYTTMGQYSKAEDCNAQALSIHRELSQGSDSMPLGDSPSNLGEPADLSNKTGLFSAIDKLLEKTGQTTRRKKSIVVEHGAFHNENPRAADEHYPSDDGEDPDFLPTAYHKEDWGTENDVVEKEEDSLGDSSTLYPAFSQQEVFQSDGTIGSQSCNKLDIEFNHFHEETQRDLLSSSDQTTSGAKTVIFITIQHPGEDILQLVTLVEGIIPGIADYQSKPSLPTMFRVSTVRSRSKSKVNNLWDEEIAKKAVTDRDGTSGTFSRHLTFVNHCPAWPIRLSQFEILPHNPNTDSRSLQEIEGKIKFELHECPAMIYISVLSNDGQQVLDTVRGSLAAIENISDISSSDTDSENSCSSNESQLSDLDLPLHTSIVTVRKMRKITEDGDCLYLYHLSAGFLQQSLNKDKHKIMMVTERIMNDDLFEAIRHHCEEDLTAAGVGKEKKEKLYKESPHFIVTKVMPSYQDGKLCLKTIQPEIDKSGEKESYIYRHPSDCAMMIKVGEPNSPAPIDYTTMGQYSKAEDCNAQALSIHRELSQGSDSTPLGDSPSNLGEPADLSNKTGHFSAIDKLLEKTGQTTRRKKSIVVEHGAFHNENPRAADEHYPSDDGEDPEFLPTAYHKEDWGTENDVVEKEEDSLGHSSTLYPAFSQQEVFQSDGTIGSQSCNKLDIKFNHFHEETQRDLLSSSDQTTSGAKTVIFITIQHPGEGILQLVTLVEGIIPGIADYQSKPSLPTMFRVSTVRSRSKSKVNNLWDEEIAKKAVTDRDGTSGTFPRHLTFVNHCPAWPIRLSQFEILPHNPNTDSRSLQEIEGKIKFELHECPAMIYISVLSNDGQHVLDTVRGSLAAIENISDISSSDTDGENSCSSNESQLSDLDLPLHTSIVTVRKMRKITEDGDCLYLYHLSAGFLQQSLNKDKHKIMMVTERIMNDELFEAIRHHCEEDLTAAGVGKEKKEKLYKESPHFIVTKVMPSYQDGKLCLKTIQPEIDKSGEKESYIYRHPSDCAMMIKVGEPNSPAPINYVYDKQQSLTSSTAYYGDKANAQVIEDLMKAQERLYNILMNEFNESLMDENLKLNCHDVDSRVTLVISTLRTPASSEIRTMVHFVKGILLPDSENGTIYKNDGYGMITSIRWLNSSFLLNRLQSKWNKHEGTLCPNWKERTTAFQPHGLIKFTCILGGVEICLPMVLQDNLKMVLAMKNDHEKVVFSAYPATIGRFKLEVISERPTIEVKFKLVHSYEISPTQELSSRLNEDNLQQELCETLNVSDSKEAHPLRLSIHEVKSVLRSSKILSNQVDTTVFALLAKGEQQNIRLPESFEYQDALNSWRSKTMTLQQSPSLCQAVVSNWLERQIPTSERTLKMAPHMVFIRQGRKGSFESQVLVKRVESNLRTVRIKCKSKCKPILDIKSHNADPKSLEHQMEYIPDYPEVCRIVTTMSDEDIIASPVFNSFYTKLLTMIPYSYQYPTIGLKHTILAMPSHLGHCLEDTQESGLVHLNADRAHIPFCENDLSADIPTKQDVIQKIRDIRARQEA